MYLYIFGLFPGLAYFYRSMSQAATKVKDLLAAIPAATRRKAEKFPVREAEELDKGTWVAFVDEGAESYDVQLSLSRGNLLQHTCDCGKLDAEGFCLHQLAVLLQVSSLSGKTPLATATKRKKKEDPLETMLGQISQEELQEWVRTLLQQHKNLQMDFMSRFGPKPDDYTAEEIKQMTDAAVKSVVKNKKKIDQTELRQILDLWKKVHAPVLECCISHIANPDKLHMMNALLEAVRYWCGTLLINSVKLDNYLTDLYNALIAPLHKMAVEDTWQKVIHAYNLQVQIIDNALSPLWVHFLCRLVVAETHSNRADFILNELKATYLLFSSKKGQVPGSWFTKLLMETYSKLNKKEECIEWLHTLTYDDEFNLKLINELIENDKLERAERLSKDCIKQNYQKQYNTPYLVLLKRIYRKQPAQLLKLYEVILEIFPVGCSIDDYKLIKENYYKNNIDLQKKWVTKAIQSLSGSAIYDYYVADLFFSICKYEGKLDKMLDKIEDSKVVQMPLLYFDDLYDYSKKVFLKRLATLNINYSLENNNLELARLLAKKIKEKYTNVEISTIFNNSGRYWGKNFVDFCKEQWNK